MSIAEQKDATVRWVAGQNFEAAMQKIAETLNISEDKMKAALQKVQIDREGKERALAAEIAMARETGEHAGGSI